MGRRQDVYHDFAKAIRITCYAAHVIYNEGLENIKVRFRTAKPDFLMLFSLVLIRL